ncbi:FtsX-like permease family protein [Catenulispora yoronensis]
MTADTAAALATQLGRLTDPAAGRPCTPAVFAQPVQCGPFVATSAGLSVAADIKPTLDRFVAARAEVWVVDSFSLASVATVALITLFSAARLAVGRRERDLVLHRARGASIRDLMTVRAAHGILLTVPALLVGWLAARLLLHIGRHRAQSSGPGAGWMLAAIAVAGLVVLPALTWARSRPRPDVADRAVAIRRRLAVEIGILVLAAAAVVSLHGRGVDGLRNAGIDPQISLVPALLGAVGAALLLRLHPLLLGGSLRWARRRRSAVPVLAFAQARRGPGLGAAGLLVLVLTLAGLVFGGLVTRTVTGAHADVANSVGGDAVIQGRGLIEAVRSDVAGVAGVQHVIAEQTLWLTPDTPAGSASVTSAPTAVPIKTVAVDVKALAAADPNSRLVHLLSGSASSNSPISAYASASAVRQNSATLSVATPTGSAALNLTAVGTLTLADLRVIGAELGDLTPQDPFLVVPLTAAARLAPGSDPDTLVVDGPGIAETELRAALPTAVTYQVQTHRALMSSLDTATLTDSLDLVAFGSALLASAFALLAVVLELLAGARARGQAVSFLRTMGLRSRSATSMLILQLLPPAVLAAVAGVGLGALIPRLLGSALRLRAVTGGTAEPRIRVDFATSAALGAGVVALVLLAALIDHRLARRRKLGAVLRFDSR